jgi:hypothetical protein
MNKNNGITLVRVVMPDFDATYAAPPGSWPRSIAAIDETLITDPFNLALHMRLHTCFVTSHVPVRFVFIKSFHFSSGQSNTEYTLSGNVRWKLGQEIKVLLVIWYVSVTSLFGF